MECRERSQFSPVLRPFLPCSCLPDPATRLSQLGCMSTTTEKEEAEKYAAYSGAPVIFEIQQGMVCKGAHVEWLSQFPSEKEVLFGPLTVCEVHRVRCDGAFQVIEMRPATSHASAMGAMELLTEARMSAVIEMIGIKLKKGSEIEGMPASQKDSQLGRTLAYHKSAALMSQVVSETADTCARDQTIAREMRERVGAREELRHYVLAIRNQLLLGRTCNFNRLVPNYNPGNPLSDYVDDGDKGWIEKALAEAEKHIEHRQSSKKQFFEESLQRLKDLCAPIISRMYEETGLKPPNEGLRAEEGDHFDLELRSLEQKRADVARRSELAAKAYQENEQYAREVVKGVEKLNRYTVIEQKERKGKAKKRWGLAGGTVKKDINQVLTAAQQDKKVCEYMLEWGWAM